MAVTVGVLWCLLGAGGIALVGLDALNGIRLVDFRAVPTQRFHPDLTHPILA